MRAEGLDNRSLGRRGEDVAAEHLRSLGFTIVGRNVRTRYGEIDIIAREGDTLVFVEVKARRGIRFGTPEEGLSARKQAQVRCLQVLVAAERYRLQKKAWPGKLDDLVSAGLLGAVPRDPYDGKTLRFARRGDGVTIYSVGHDRTDDGGIIDRSRPMDPGVDLGYRLWDVKSRRQPPVPRPKPPPMWHPGMGEPGGPMPGAAPPPVVPIERK